MPFPIALLPTSGLSGLGDEVLLWSGTYGEPSVNSTMKRTGGDSGVVVDYPYSVENGSGAAAGNSCIRMQNVEITRIEQDTSSNQAVAFANANTSFTYCRWNSTNKNWFTNLALTSDAVCSFVYLPNAVSRSAWPINIYGRRKA